MKFEWSIGSNFHIPHFLSLVLTKPSPIQAAKSGNSNSSIKNDNVSTGGKNEDSGTNENKFEIKIGLIMINLQ